MKTDKQILLGLECCGDEEELLWCTECPYYDKENAFCQEDLHRDALELLKRKDAWIDRLSDRNRRCIYLSDDETTEYCVDGACPKFKTEIEIKAEAIKKFAERLVLVEETTAINCATSEKVVRVTDIDNLVKEMVGEQNG